MLCYCKVLAKPSTTRSGSTTLRTWNHKTSIALGNNRSLAWFKAIFEKITLLFCYIWGDLGWGGYKLPQLWGHWRACWLPLAHGIERSWPLDDAWVWFVQKLTALQKALCINTHIMYIHCFLDMIYIYIYICNMYIMYNDINTMEWHMHNNDVWVAAMYAHVARTVTLNCHHLRRNPLSHCYSTGWFTGILSVKSLYNKVANQASNNVHRAQHINSELVCCDSTKPWVIDRLKTQKSDYPGGDVGSGNLAFNIMTAYYTYKLLLMYLYIYCLNGIFPGWSCSCGICLYQILSMVSTVLYVVGMCIFTKKRVGQSS